MRNPFTTLAKKVGGAFNSAKEALGFKPKSGVTMAEAIADAKAQQEALPVNLVNKLHNRNAMMNNRKRRNRVRNKMQRESRKQNRGK